MSEKTCVCGQSIIWNELKGKYYNYVTGIGGIRATPHRCPQYKNKRFANATPAKPQNTDMVCPSCGIVYYTNVFVLCPNCYKIECRRCKRLRTYKIGLTICAECFCDDFEVIPTKEYVDNLINKLKPR